MDASTDVGKFSSRFGKLCDSDVFRRWYARHEYEVGNLEGERLTVVFEAFEKGGPAIATKVLRMWRVRG